MGFETAIFYELMPNTVTISTRTGHSNYGEPTFSTAGTSRRARVLRKQGFIRGTEQTIAYQSVVWVHSTGDTAAVDDRVTFGGASYPIVSVERVPDGDGVHHVKYYLGE